MRREKVALAWTHFLREVGRRFKKTQPRIPASAWVGAKSNSLPKICGHTQAALVAKFGIQTSTVRRMRATLVVLLEIGEGHAKPTPAKQTFRQFRKWSDAEKATRELIKRQREARKEEVRTGPQFSLSDFMKTVPPKS